MVIDKRALMKEMDLRFLNNGHHSIQTIHSLKRTSITWGFANGIKCQSMHFYTYNVLSVFAPEIRGKWNFVAVPGTEYLDEHGQTQIRRETVATGTGGGGILRGKPSIRPQKRRVMGIPKRWWIY